MSKKVYIVGGGMAVAIAFQNAGYEVVADVRGADLAVFTGGEDVSPALYGEKDVKSYTNKERDCRELFKYHCAKALNIPCVGICRGGQFLNVLSGGKLWQDVDNHGIAGHGVHEVSCSFTGEKHSVSSTHHQMMVAGDKGVVIAVADRSAYKTNDKGTFEMTKDDRDIEVMFYPEANNLCFQGHPEFFGPGHSCFDYFFLLVKHQLEGTLK